MSAVSVSPPGAAVNGLEGHVIGQGFAVGGDVGRYDAGLVIRGAVALGAVNGGVNVLLAHGAPLLGEPAAGQQQRQAQRQRYYPVFFH